MVDEFEDAVLPYIVIDYESLFIGKEVNEQRLMVIEAIFDFFNIVVWKDSSWRKQMGYVFKDKDLKLFYEFDLVKFIVCDPKKMLRFVKFHKSIMLTDNGSVLGVFGRSAKRCFEPNEIINNFDFWRKFSG